MLRLYVSYPVIGSVLPAILKLVKVAILVVKKELRKPQIAEIAEIATSRDINL